MWKTQCDRCWRNGREATIGETILQRYMETVASLQIVFSPSVPVLDDISEKKISWRYGHGWPWTLCGRSHRRHRACRRSAPAADHQTVSQLSTTLLSPVPTPGVSASDGSSDAPRSGRPDVRQAAKAGCDLFATSLSGLWTLFQRRHAGPGLAQRTLHPPCHAHGRPPGGRRWFALSNRQLAPVA